MVSVSTGWRAPVSARVVTWLLGLEAILLALTFVGLPVAIVAAVAWSMASRRRHWRFCFYLQLALCTVAVVFVIATGSLGPALAGTLPALVALLLLGEPVRNAFEARVRPDMCPQCGYDLRESVARCPECGLPFVRRRSFLLRWGSPAKSR